MSLQNINEKFEEKFKEIGAADVFKPLKLNNSDDLQDALMDYGGDKDELKKLINSYKAAIEAEEEKRQPKPPKKQLPYFDNDSGSFVPLWMAQDLMEDYSFATHEENENIYVYNDGIYEPKGKIIVKGEAQRRLGRHVKSHYIKETVDAVKRENYIPQEKFNNPNDGIVVKNGLLDIHNRELKDHSPEYIHLSKIKAAYDPEADCPKIKQFISEIVNEDDIKLVQEMFGYCLLKDYPIAKAFMMLGSGANGKSTLLTLLERFLGNDNVANPSLQELLDNRFAKIELFGNLANIHADLSSEKLNRTGTFKMLTGGDTIRGEKKFQDAIEFGNHAKLIYSANELPKTNDRTEAFFRRWIVIDFPHQFSENNEDTDPDLPGSIIDEEEMSGLLNWALDGLDRVLENDGFSQTESRNEIERKWIMETDSLRAFLDIATNVETDGWTAKEDLYEVYKEFCDKNNLYVAKKGPVTKRIPTLEPQVEIYKPKIEGKQVRCWRNLVLKKSFIKEGDYRQDRQGIRTSLIVGAKAYKKNSQNTLPKLSRDKNEEEKVKGDVIEQALRLYPNSQSDGKGLGLISALIQEELGVTSDEFDKIHSDLKNRRDAIMELNGKWKRV